MRIHFAMNYHTAGNVSIEQDVADNWKPSKNKSWEKIDGIVAFVATLALAPWYVSYGSVYEEPGMLTG
ncbi:hypothetical protein OAS39_07530 [Pirellulales bacterium]|nr:hypothetical protein [Pirellulales bacterium]